MNLYQDIPQIKINNISIYKTIIWPEIPLSEDDIYIYTSETDRFDTLANEYYGDSSLWKLIATANPKYKIGTLNIPGGVQIRIPSDPQGIIKKFNLINQ